MKNLIIGDDYYQLISKIQLFPLEPKEIDKIKNSKWFKDILQINKNK